MSATRDPSEKITFLYTPMGKLVRQIRETEIPAAAPARPQAPMGLTRSRVLKTDDLRVRKTGARELVREFRAPAIAPAPAAAVIAPAARHLFEADASLHRTRAGAVGLRQSLGELEDLQKRFRFLLQELEELIQD